VQRFVTPKVVMVTARRARNHGLGQFPVLVLQRRQRSTSLDPIDIEYEQSSRAACNDPDIRFWKLGPETINFSPFASGNFLPTLDRRGF
jgi:hypothetical protein